MTSPRLRKTLFIVLAIACLDPRVSSAIALFAGIAFALVFHNPFLERSRKFTPKLLQLSVIGLGAGMDLNVVGRVGIQGVGYTVVGISLALGLGWILGRLLKTSRDTAMLINVGTAICGGSAIAAVAPVIRAKSAEVTVALGVVFTLNALALFMFPPLAHLLNLSQSQFGLWCALAIHDTSSVVGASMQYGAEALQIATTVKLARALWIVPLAFLVGLVRSKQGLEAGQKAKKPWFILGFLLAAAVVSWIPALRPAGHVVDAIAKRTLVLTLFLIGASLNRDTLRAVGLRPLLHGVCLWALVGGGTLMAILAGWIH